MKEIVKEYGNCEVTLVFTEKDSNVLERVKWLLLENYADRVLKEKEFDQTGRKNFFHSQDEKNQKALDNSDKICFNNLK